MVGYVTLATNDVTRAARSYHAPYRKAPELG